MAVTALQESRYKESFLFDTVRRISLKNRLVSKSVFLWRFRPRSSLFFLWASLAFAGELPCYFCAWRKMLGLIRFKYTIKTKSIAKGDGFCFYGAPAGIRTRDPLIKSQLLYQLSYRCIYRTGDIVSQSIRIVKPFFNVFSIFLSEILLKSQIRSPAASAIILFDSLFEDALTSKYRAEVSPRPR